MPLFEVAFTFVPSIKAQESGAEESIAVAPVSVCAKDGAAAIAVVAARNGNALNEPKDGSTLRAHVRPFPFTG